MRLKPYEEYSDHPKLCKCSREMSNWLIAKMMGDDKDAPRVLCKRSYAIYAMSRKSKFPEIFERSDIEPRTITEVYIPKDVVYGSKQDGKHLKLVGRQAAMVLSDEVIAAIHVDPKVIPVVSERAKNKSHFTVDRYRMHS